MMHEALELELDLVSAFGRLAAPRPSISVSEWADRYRILSSVSSGEPGPWRTARTPYLREILDVLSDASDVREVVFWAPTQVGKSEACLCFLGYTMDRNPGPVMLVQPTLDTSKAFSKQRVADLIRSTPVLTEIVRPSRSRDSGNTLLNKEYRGGLLRITGANSEPGLRSMPARDLILDEIDAYPLTVGERGDPISLAEKRQDSFRRRKTLKTSTCTIKGESRIEQAYAASDRRRYWVPCPYCGERQVLKWGNLKWIEDDPDSAHYACEHCGCLIEETKKPGMLAGGEWRPDAPASPIRGYWLNALYAPLGWLSWADIIAEFLAANAAAELGDTTLLQVWTNCRLAETWELKGADVPEHELQRRADPYPLRSVPPGALQLTAAVDVQGDRLEVLVVGWGASEESWILDLAKLYGDPAEETVWTDLDEYLTAPLVNAWGTRLYATATAIDHGGHHAARVEWYARTRAIRHVDGVRLDVLAVKGQSQRDKPILGKPSERDTTFRGRKVKAGFRLWPVGVFEGKRLVYERLGLERPGPGFVHTSTGLDDEFYKQLTAEMLVTKHVRGRPRQEWVLKRGTRNEALDLMVYNLAAAAYLAIPRRRPADWERIAARVEPRESAPLELELPPAAAIAAANPARPGAVPRRFDPFARPRGGFVGRY